MGLFKKKEKSVSDKDLREVEIIDTEQVAKSEKDKLSKKKVTNSYNMTNIRKLSTSQKVLIGVSVVFMGGSLFFSSRILGNRSDVLSSLQSEITKVKNEIVTLESTSTIIDETLGNTDYYHTIERQNIDDEYVMATLNSHLQWKVVNDANKENMKLSLSKYMPDSTSDSSANNLLDIFFGDSINRVGYKLDSDDKILAIPSIESYTVQLGKNSRSYMSIVEFVYGGLDNQLYKKNVALTYTVYDVGKDDEASLALGQLCAYDVYEGHESGVIQEVNASVSSNNQSDTTIDEETNTTNT